MRIAPLLLVLLGACSTYQAAPLAPEDVLLDLRSVRVDLPADGLDPATAVALALTHNPGLRGWRRKHDIAERLVISESAWKNPELRVGLDNLHSRLGAPFEYALALRFFPPLPGEQDALRERSQARVRRVLAEIEEREARVARQTRLAHARLVRVDSELAIVRAAVALAKRTDAIVAERIAAGLATRLDESLVLLRGEALANELQTLGSERAIAGAELAALLAAPLDAEIVVRPGPQQPVDRALVETDLEALALVQRPDLRSLAEEYGEREQQLRLRHLAKIPWPRHVEAGFGGLPDAGTFDVGLAMEIPVLDTAGAEIAVAESRRDRVGDEFRAQVHNVRREIRVAVLDLREQERWRDRISKRLEPLLRDAEELVTTALRGGAADVLAVVAIETRVLDARRSAVRAAYEHERARIALSAAVGDLH